MCLGCSGFGRLWPSVAKVCKMTISLTISALVLSCRTHETFNEFRITTHRTSISSFMCLACIRFFLVGWSFIPVCTWVPFLALWSELVRLLFLHAHAWGSLFYDTSKDQLELLGVTCNIFYVPSGRLWRFHFLGKLPHLACWKLLQIYIWTIDGLGDKLLIFSENQNILLCKILAVSGGYLEKDNWAWTALYHSSTDQLPCLKLVSRSNLSLTSLLCGLQKSSYLAQITSQLRSSVDKHHDTYWYIP